MNDTSSAVQNKLFEMMQQKNEVERFFMGASMSDMARSITRAAILENRPDISPAEFRGEFFRRWYWEDFDSSIREKVLEAVLLRDEAF